MLNYLLSTNLEVVNEGSESTFVTSTRAEVIDVTLANKWSRNLNLNWAVSTEDSGLGHRFLRFTVGVLKPEASFVRNLQKADWKVFKESHSSRLSQYA